MYYNITIFFTICCHTYWMHQQGYGSENFSQHYHGINPLRTVVPYMHDGKMEFYTCEQITITSLSLA